MTNLNEKNLAIVQLREKKYLVDKKLAHAIMTNMYAEKDYEYEKYRISRYNIADCYHKTDELKNLIESSLQEIKKYSTELKNLETSLTNLKKDKLNVNY